jgi:hypothetical protein
VKYFILAAVFYFAYSVFAEQADVTVWTSGSTRSARMLFSQPGVKVLGAKEQQELYRKAGYLPVETRNEIFRAAGVIKKVESSMDELDKDMFVMALREYTLKELSEDYSAFSQSELRTLKTKVEQAL